MKVMGIDIGTKITGYAILNGEKIITAGECRLPRNTSLSEKIKLLYNEIKKVMEKERPDYVVSETLFYKQNAKTLAVLAHLRGIILLLAEELGIKLVEFTPAEIKKTITGNGRASKYQMNKMVEKIVKQRVVSTDISDAVASALCYLYRREKRIPT